MRIEIDVSFGFQALGIACRRIGRLDDGEEFRSVLALLARAIARALAATERHVETYLTRTFHARLRQDLPHCDNGVLLNSVPKCPELFGLPLLMTILSCSKAW